MPFDSPSHTLQRTCVPCSIGIRHLHVSFSLLNLRVPKKALIFAKESALFLSSLINTSVCVCTYVLARGMCGDQRSTLGVCPLLPLGVRQSPPAGRRAPEASPASVFPLTDGITGTHCGIRLLCDTTGESKLKSSCRHTERCILKALLPAPINFRFLFLSFSV